MWKCSIESSRLLRSKAKYMKLQRLLSSWKQYKYRFVPWLAYNWTKKRESIRRLPKSDDYNPEKEKKVIGDLQHLFEALYKHEIGNGETKEIFERECGFLIEKQPSSIRDAGTGVFVSSGCIPEDHIAAMYPGTIYYPSDPLFFQSIKNPFVLRCVDGLMIDGNNKRLSKYIYKSCCGRDMIGPYKPCDTSWLTDDLKNPFAIGQFVNNQTETLPANVAYHEFDVPIHLIFF